ncbi:MAG: PKD domain-containing protein [bacterium]
MKKFLFTLIAFTLFSPIAFANTFVFSTDPQTINPGDLSGPITIQSRTDSGDPLKVTQTTYIAFTSSSATGQFVSSSGVELTPTKIYISTGDTSRTVYYKDTSSGDFTITTVLATGAERTQVATITQHITVGGGGSGGGSTATTTDQTASGTNTTTTTTTTSDYTPSAHSSPASLSNADEPMTFEISAGRSRLTSVGNTLAFVATPTKLQKVSEQMIFYTWSFGDGSTGQGSVVNHSYKFPGEYSVVVNATAVDKQAVDRITVKVVSPDISISKVSDGVEVYNKTNAEINLEGWTLSGGVKVFTFPKDTLIPAGKKVVFPNDVTGMYATSIALYNPLGRQFAYVVDTLPTPIARSSQVSLAMSERAIPETVSETIPKAVTTDAPKAHSLLSAQIQKATPIKNEVATSGENNTDQTANVTEVFQAPKRVGFINTLFSWPISGFNFIKHLFVEE